MACNYLGSHFQMPIIINQTNPCRDMFVGQLSNRQYTANNQRYQNSDAYAIDYNSSSISYDLNNPNSFQNDILVCILESPHRDEYLINTNTRWGHAAMGQTGKLFDKNFYNMLSQNHGNIAIGTYDVVLLNSVQFQCSNGLRPLNKTVRDGNWNSMINNNEVYDDLLRRIESLNPRYIINLCTKGNINLQLILHAKLLAGNVLQGTRFTHGWHPSSWYNPNANIY